MKKLFVSVPMKGREPEDIKASIVKMKKIAEAYVGEELELLDSYIYEKPPENSNPAIWYLGKSLEKLSMADIFIGINDYWCWNGCRIETEAARLYGLKHYCVDVDIIFSEQEKSFCEVEILE